jgi:hypothetical protein
MAVSNHWCDKLYENILTQNACFDVDTSDQDRTEDRSRCAPAKHITQFL